MMANETTFSKETMEEVKGTMKLFLKDPVQAATNGQYLSKGAALSFLGIQTLSFWFLIWFTTNINWGFPLPTNMYVYSIILGALNTAVILGMLLVTPKILKIEIDKLKVLSTTALASIPWTLALLINTLVILIFSGTVMTTLLIVVILFAFVSSLLLLSAGFTSLIKNGYHRMLTISLTYAIGLPVYMYLFTQISADLFQEILNSLLWLY